MGLFTRVTKIKEEKNILPVQKEIDTIVSIMNNLSLLDTKKIESFLINEKTEYDKSVLNRLMISVDEESIKELKKYYNPSNLGYGEIKLLSIRDNLEQLARTEISNGKNNFEVVEELINYSKQFIVDYKIIINDFNNIIKKLEKSCNNKSELFAMMDYWYNNIKEEKLGYMPDIDKKINTMAIKLANLPFGGYGIDKIEEFKDLANHMVAVEQNNGFSADHIIGMIEKDLFTPRYNRYLSDVKALQTKIDLIRKSIQISDEQKKENITKVIAEFNQMYGHKLESKEPQTAKTDNSTFLEEVNIEKLVNIDESKGYGPKAILAYRRYCKKIMNSDLPEDEKYIEINKRADFLIKKYLSNKELFNKWKAVQLDEVSELEMNDKEQELNRQVDYMLSLSPEDFNRYLLEDSKKKKIAAEKHNEELVIRYLAKQEADSKNDKDIYDLRLNEHYAGQKPYTKEQLDSAYNQLLIASLTDDTNYSGKFIDAVAYIDSTLVKQIYSLASTNSTVK